MNDKMREALEALEYIFTVADKDGAVSCHDEYEVVKRALTQQPESARVDPWLIHCLEYIGNDDREAIDSDAFEIYGEDEQGRSGTVEVSITDLCLKAAEALRRPQPTPQVPEAKTLDKIKWHGFGENVFKEKKAWVDGWNSCRKKMLTASPSIEERREPDQPDLPLADGYVLLPRELTAENGAKNLLMGEFSESVTRHCDQCDGEDFDCEICNGADEYSVDVPVEWTTIKNIHRMVVEHLSRPAPPAGGE